MSPKALEVLRELERRRCGVSHRHVLPDALQLDGRLFQVLGSEVHVIHGAQDKHGRSQGRERDQLPMLAGPASQHDGLLDEDVLGLGWLRGRAAPGKGVPTLGHDAWRTLARVPKDLLESGSEPVVEERES